MCTETGDGPQGFCSTIFQICFLHTRGQKFTQDQKNHTNISFLVSPFLLKSGEAYYRDLAPFIFMNIGFCMSLFICTVSRRWKNCVPPLHKLSNPHRSTIGQKSIAWSPQLLKTTQKVTITRPALENPQIPCSLSQSLHDILSNTDCYFSLREDTS